MGGRERDLMEAESRNMRELAARRRVQPAAMFPVTSASMYSYSQMGVSKNRGTPKWMVKIMENPINPWMIWGENPTIFGNIQMFFS